MLCWLSLQTTGVAMAQQTAVDSPPGMLVYSGSRHMHIHCTGAASAAQTPTVVLEAGLGSTLLDWRSVQQQLSTRGRVCAYDRGGYGWSERAAGPRVVPILARELDQLLLMAGEKPPFVITGHSFGGLVALYYAYRYPNKTAGLALIDSTHPQQFAVFDQAGIPTPQAPSGGTFFIRNFANVPDALPAPLKPLAQRLASQRKTVEVLYSELRSLRRNADLVSDIMPELPDVPVAVLSRSGQPDASATAAQRLRETVWLELQQSLADKFNTRLQVSAGNNHYLHLLEPTFVANAVADLAGYR